MSSENSSANDSQNGSVESGAGSVTGKLLPFKPKAPTFEIRISDNSMKGAGIYKGDAVRFTRTREFKNGDLVAVKTPGGLFITSIFRATACNLVVLIAANPRHRCRVYSAHKIKVLGVATPVEDSPQTDEMPVVSVEDLDWPDVIGGEQEGGGSR